MLGAKVTIRNKTIATDATGIAVFPVPLGTVEVAVAKEGVLPGSASLSITEPREWQMILELQPQPSQKEEITVHATRTDTRLQDSPTRVEVLEQEEIEEKLLMTPGDIVMMLNEMGGLRCKPHHRRSALPAFAFRACADAMRDLCLTVCRFSASKAGDWACCKFRQWIWARSK
ncbi:MAG: hypothetical protein ABI693_17915 [Bryobacteraceae bacterium]